MSIFLSVIYPNDLKKNTKPISTLIRDADHSTEDQMHLLVIALSKSISTLSR